MTRVPASNSNPFATIYNVASGALAARERVRGQQVNTEAVIAGIAAQHHATTLQAEQNAGIAEAAAASEHDRRTNFFESIMKHAEGGTPVSFTHGNMSVAITKSTQPASGRVPVKKNRGGKKNR